MDNPFRYGRVATGEFFVGREKELRDLENDVRAGQDVVIISPRRYGKTSLVLETIERLRRQKVLAAYVDLFRTPTKEQLVRGLANALYAGLADVKGRVWEKARELFGKVSLHPTATINPDGSYTLELAPADRVQSLDSVLERLLSLPQKIAEERKRRVVLVLDEFQQITEIDPHLPAIMRAEFQLQRDVVHLFAGSQRHMMARLFTAANEPMYRMAKPMHLGPIDIGVFAGFICSRFASTDQQITDDATARILEITGGHPANTQELCYFTWNLAATEKVAATVELVDRALAEVIDAEDDRFTVIWSHLSANQRLVLTALVASDGSPAIYSESYRRAYGLGASSTVHRSVSALIDADLVKTTANGEHHVPDPFFRAWIARTAAIGANIRV